ADRFAFYFAKDKQHLMNLIPKYYPDTEVPVPPDVNLVLKKAGEYKSAHDWAGATLRQMAEESTGDHEDDQAASFAYEIVYKFTSHHCHATVVALDPDHLVQGGQPFIVHSGNTEPGRFADYALFNIVVCLHRILFLTFRVLGDLDHQAKLLLRL